MNECATNNGNCSQLCTNAIGSYACTCSTGYVLDNDLRTCNGKFYYFKRFQLLVFTFSDVNECASNNGNCDAICTNTVGSYRCSCMGGFMLNVDGRTCDGT